MLTFEIYYKDLERDVQDALLRKFNTSICDENWDYFPLVIIEREEINDND